MEDVGIHAFGEPLYLQVPAAWEGTINPQEIYTIIWLTGDYAALEIFIADLIAYGYEDYSLQEYVDADIQTLENAVDVMPEFDLLSRESVTNAQGFEVEIITYNHNIDGLVTCKRLYYIHEDIAIFVLSFYAPANNLDEFEPVFDYSFSTFRIGD
jgi:hypothetical protein